MNLKKRLKKFFTLRRRGQEGFTLVELIVVIAIMGILAGVGTVAYSGYITNANKNADKVLVGNIIRAIETGTNSTMFVPEDSVLISATSYPVGFVVLSQDGVNVLTSSAEYKKAEGADAPCEFVNETINVPVRGKQSFSCNKGHSKELEVYSLNSKTVTYCKTHTAQADQPAISENAITTSFADSYSRTGCKYTHICNAKTEITSYLTIAAGTMYCADQSKLLTKVAGTDLCSYAYYNQYGYFVSPEGAEKLVPAEGGNAITEAISIAFGGMNDLKLAYDSWGKDDEDDFAYATLYTYASDMFENVKDMAGLLVKLQPLKDVGSFGSYFTGNYADSADLISQFSAFVSEKMTPEKWDSAWYGAAEATDDEYVFELNKVGAKNDFMWAARLAYNSGFASYCEAHGISSPYVSLIAEYGENAYSEIGEKAKNMTGLGDFGKFIVENTLKVIASDYKDTNIPSVVNLYALKQTGEGSLKKAFTDKGDDGTVFQKVSDLYDKYWKSEACVENGRAFYSTMETVDETSDVAKTKGGDDQFVAFYKNYLDEMANVYKAAEALAGDGIIIIVSVEKGVVTCTVTPSSANPRK